MRKYEIMYIIRPDLPEDERKALVEELGNVLTSNGAEIRKANEWGMRDLAYEIDHHRKGYYMVLHVTAPEAARAEFDRIIHLKEDIIRFLVVKDEQ